MPTDDRTLGVDSVVQAIMRRATAASGQAVFVDPVILRDILAPLVAEAEKREREAGLREAAQRLNYVEMLKRAKGIVRASPLWKRFIDGTPLSNDAAVWMVDFACTEIAALRARAGEEAR